MDMNLYGIIFFLLLGAIIGSFLNVVVLRMRTGVTLQGRSECYSCARQLTWYELVPIVSFFVLRGRCRTCKAKIAWQYPLVEASTAIVFLLSFLKLGITPQLFLVLLLWSFVIASVVYDVRHTILPDTLLLPFLLISLIFALIRGDGAYAVISTVLAGVIVALPLLALWFITKGKGMGLGDVKFALGMGWLLGIVEGINALILSFWIGAVVSLFAIFYERVINRKQLMANGKGLTMKSEIPFGPFLAIGMALVYFFDVSVLPF